MYSASAGVVINYIKRNFAHIKNDITVHNIMQ